MLAVRRLKMPTTNERGQAILSDSPNNSIRRDSLKVLRELKEGAKQSEHRPMSTELLSKISLLCSHWSNHNRPRYICCLTWRLGDKHLLGFKDSYAIAHYAAKAAWHYRRKDKLIKYFRIAFLSEPFSTRNAELFNWLHRLGVSRAKIVHECLHSCDLTRSELVELGGAAFTLNLDWSLPFRHSDSCHKSGHHRSAMANPVNMATSPSAAFPSAVLGHKCRVARIKKYQYVQTKGGIVAKLSGPDLSFLKARCVQDEVLSLVNCTNPLSLNGLSCIISDQYSANNYAHWLLDMLPRLLICEELGLDINYVLAYDYINQWNIDSLSGLAKCEYPVIDLRRTRCVECEWLVGIDNISVATSHPLHHASPYLASLLRKRAARLISQPRAANRLYISRAKSRRGLVNEDQVRQLLVEDHRFEEVFLEDLSFPEQVSKVSSASAIFSPHGAGLANIVFCHKGTNIFEAMPPSFGTKGFQMISSTLGLNYRRVIGCYPDRDSIPGHYGQALISKPYSIEVPKVEAWINSI